MRKGLIFFCCACAILLFTIINLSIGPIVSGTVESFDRNWGTLNCKKERDDYDKAKDRGDSGDTLKYGAEWDLNECDRKKGMHDMEYTSFIFNIVIGFVCALLGLLHLFDIKKEFVPKTGLIALACGVIGFIFSFVYIILNGLVYTTVDTGIVKLNSDGAYAERQGGATSTQYKCLYYDKPLNRHSFQAKFSDLIKKQYNYDKDLHKTISALQIQNSNCVTSGLCYNSDTITHTSGCEYLYEPATTSIKNKDISDRFLTALILSLFLCLANIGMGIFGFLLYRTPSEF